MLHWVPYDYIVHNHVVFRQIDTAGNGYCWCGEWVYLYLSDLAPTSASTVPPGP